MAADRNVVPPARLCSRSSGGAHARPQNQPRRPQSTSLTDGSEASGAEGAWYKDFGSFKLCGEGRYPKTFLLAGGGHGAEALTEHSRLIINPAAHSRHGLSPLDPPRLGLSASLNLTACRRTYSSTQRKVEKATDSEPSQAGIS